MNIYIKIYTYIYSLNIWNTYGIFNGILLSTKSKGNSDTDYSIDER